MPTNRRKRNRVAALDHWKIDDLVTGECFLGAGYVPITNRHGCAYWTADDWAEVHAAMREDWAVHGAAVMAWWRGETEQFTYWAGSSENQRDKLRDWIGRSGHTEPFAARAFGAAE